MTDIDIRGVEVSVDGDQLQDYQVSELSMTSSVNALPSVTMKGNRVGEAEDGKVLSGNDLSDIASNLSSHQNTMFQKETDATVTVTQKHHSEGFEKSIEFSGVASSPKLNISPGKVLESHSVIHKDWKISGINLAIYQDSKPIGSDSADVGGGRVPSPLGPEFNPSNAGFSVAKALSKLVRVILDIDDSVKKRFKLKNFESNGATTTEDTHAQNIELYNSILKPILEGSEEGTKMFMPQAGALKCKEASFQGWLKQAAMSNNFLQAFQGIINDTFLFQHICNFDTPEGGSRMLHSQVNATPSQSVSVDVVSLNYSLGGLGELPLGQILASHSSAIEIGGAQHKNPSSTSGAQFLPIFLPASAWPEIKTPPHGETKHIKVPSCFDVTTATQSAGPSEANDAQKGKAQGRKKDRIKDLTKDFKNKSEQATKGMQFASHWAAKTYVEQALRNCTCQVTIPLDIGWGAEGVGSMPIGRVYDVSATSGNFNSPEIFLFTGYLSSVNHELSVGNELGRAMTYLTFTHVKGVNWHQNAGYTPDYGCHPWVD